MEPDSSSSDTEPDRDDPAQQRYATAVFVLRELVALLFVLGWLIIAGIDLFVFPDASIVPFWFHMLGVGVLAYALGVNVATLVPIKGVTITPIRR